MKKIICLVMCALLITTVFSVNAETQAAAKECVYGIEDFEGVNVADKAVPNSMVREGSGYSKVEGTYSYVTAGEDGNKYLEIFDNSGTDSRDTAGIRIDIPAEKRQTTGKLTLVIDVNVPKTTLHGFMINASSSNNRNELSMAIVKDSLNQNITSVENATTSVNVGKQLSFFGAWETVTFVLDLDNKQVETYVGTKKLPAAPFRYADWEQAEYSINRIQIMGCNTTPNPKHIYFDNIAIYNFEKVPQIIPENTYLVNEDFENDETGKQPSSGTVNLNMNTNNKSDKTSVTVENKESLVASQTEVPEDFANETKFVKVSDYTRNNSNSHLMYNFTPQTGKIVVEYDIFKPRWTDANKDMVSNSATLININGEKVSSGGRGVALHMWGDRVQCYSNPDGGSTQTTQIIKSADGVLQYNKWVHFKIAIDYPSKTFDLIVDGNEYKNLPLRDNLTDNLKNINVIDFAGATIQGEDEWERTAYIDNIKAYRVDQAPAVESVKYFNTEGESLNSESIDVNNLNHIEIKFASGVETAVDSASVTASAITISGAAYEKEVLGNTVKLYPVLESGKTYSLILDGIKDTLGNSSAYVQYIFKTVAEADKIYFPANSAGTFVKGETVTGKIKTAKATVGVIALYSGDKLVNINKVDVPAGVETDCPISIPNDENTYSVKLFCFNNTSAIAPELSSVTLTQAQ